MSAPQPQQPGFQHQHKFRINPTPTYSQRMTTTRADLRAFVREKLCQITGEPNAQMRWSRNSYMKDVVARYRVRIEGWPLHEVPFKNLSDVPNLPKLELLYQGFRDGTIRFRAISDAEFEAMKADPSPWIGPADNDQPEAEANEDA